MKIGLLSNKQLPRGINWTLLSDPLFAEMAKLEECDEIAPKSISVGAVSQYLELARRVRQTDAVFSLKGKARPEWPLQVMSWSAGNAVRAAFYFDPWKHAIENTVRADKLFATDLAFVPYKEAFDDLRAQAGNTRYVYLPFACDTEVFRDFGFERDIDILWMGRRHPKLHEALVEFSQRRGLNYLYREKTGFIDDPRDLGKLAARARYFVVTPPGADRSGGYSPLLMRYFEGLAAGCRLLGTLPKSGEYEALLPRESLLEIAEDGSDLAEKFDADNASDEGWNASRQAMAMVHHEHGWDARAKSIVKELKDQLVANGGNT